MNQRLERSKSVSVTRTFFKSWRELDLQLRFDFLPEMVWIVTIIPNVSEEHGTRKVV